MAALAAFGAALLARYFLNDTLGAKFPYLQFFPAVVVAAWYGGLGPGVLVTALSALSALYWLLPPKGFAVGDSADAVSLGLFVGIGLVISWLNHRLHLAQQGQRAEAATALARAERLDAVLNLSADGIMVIDANGSIEEFNRGAQDIFGFQENEVLGRKLSVLVPATDPANYASFIGGGREATGRRRDGSLLPVHFAVREMRVSGETKLMGIVHDLTNRTHLESELGGSEARWRAIIDSAVDGIIVIDVHGRIEAFNRAAERLFGYAATEVLGQNVDMLMPSPYQDEHGGYLSHYLTTGEARIIGTGREVQGRRKDGSAFPAHLSVGEFTIQGDRKFTGIVRDLSSRVHLETRLREQESLARLGEMAAVIAHEVKNPLAGIRGAIQVCAAGMLTPEEQREIFEEILARIDALDRLVKDLLLFARPPRPKRVPVELVPLVKTTANFLNADPALRDVDIEIVGEAPPVAADAEMLRIVFQNLLINGAHAMDGKGRIKIALEPVDSSCQIAVIDGGPGIPPDVRDKVFYPFFTTKVRGTGLGLPTVKRLIEAHDGEINIDCPPSGGTKVVIRLPISAA